MSDPVLTVSDLVKHYPIPSGIFGTAGVVHAVNGISLRLEPGENLALVGESGSGKSTVGKCVLRLIEPTAGRILFQGIDITHRSRREMRPLRRHMHIVFQDPYSSLNPRMTVGQIVAGPLIHHGITSGSELDGRVSHILARVGLQPEIRERYPHQLAGGQRQRVAIARALILGPSLLVADEPLSALDASVQAAIVNLLLDLQQELGFSCLFITHDLSAAEFLCDRVAVMYLGKIVEQAPRQELFTHPKHPYTQALLSAVPLPDPRAQRTRRCVVLEGTIPSPIDPPPGCAFHTRCPVAIPACRVRVPELKDVTGRGHSASCHLISPGGEAPSIADAGLAERRVAS
jgi:peptide/nickel transport system ATP-binding protein